MRVLDVTPILTVESMSASIDFYRIVLGFECLNFTEDWACLGNNGIEVMLSSPNAHLPFEKPTMTGSLYFTTDDVDAWWQQLKDQCLVVYPIEDFDYGMREFAIRDNSGHLLQFGTPNRGIKHDCHHCQKQAGIV